MRLRSAIIGLAAGSVSMILVAACAPAASPTPVPATPTVAASPIRPAASPTTAAASPTRAAAAPTTAAGGAATPSAALIATGKTVFEANCNVCHPGGAQGVGPDIKGKAVADVKKQVRTPKAQMPPIGPDKISDQQLDAVAAYVNSLK